MSRLLDGHVRVDSPRFRHHHVADRLAAHAAHPPRAGPMVLNGCFPTPDGPDRQDPGEPCAGCPVAKRDVVRLSSTRARRGERSAAADANPRGECRRQRAAELTQLAVKDDPASDGLPESPVRQPAVKRAVVGGQASPWALRTRRWSCWVAVEECEPISARALVQWCRRSGRLIGRHGPGQPRPAPVCRFGPGVDGEGPMGDVFGIFGSPRPRRSWPARTAVVTNRLR